MRGGRVAGRALAHHPGMRLSAPIRARGWPLSGQNYPLIGQDDALDVHATQIIREFKRF